MRNMKRLLAILLVLAFTVSAVACTATGSDTDTEAATEATAAAESTEETAADGEEKVSLTVLTFFDEMTYGAAYEEAWDWVAEQTGYEITVDLGGTDAYKTKRDVYLASGEMPDIMSFSGGTECEGYVRKGMLEVATDYIDNSESKFLDAYRALQCDGQEYLVPVTAGNSMFMYYNKAVFEQYGLEVPTTLDDLIAISEKLDGTGIATIGTGVSNQWLGDFIFMAMCVRANPDFYEPCKLAGNWDDAYQTYYDAAEMITNMVDLGLFNKDAAAIDVPTMNEMFKAGQYATILEGGWRWASMYDSLGDDLGYVSFPNFFGQDDYNDYALINPSMGNAVSAACENKDAAFEVCILYSYYINEYLAGEGLLNIMETDTQPESEVYEDYQLLKDDIGNLKGSVPSWSDLLDADYLSMSYNLTQQLYGGSATVNLEEWAQDYVDMMNASNLGSN